MLIDTREIETVPIQRFIRWGFSEPIAECPETGARLIASYGRRNTGRPRRYYITKPSGLLPAGIFDQQTVGTLTAYTDRDAIEKANKRLSKEGNP